MDFKHAFKLITHNFEAGNLKYAVIGGFALESAGVIRATMDIDLLVPADDKSKIKSIMLVHDYELVFESEEVITFIGTIESLGNNAGVRPAFLTLLGGKVMKFYGVTH